MSLPQKSEIAFATELDAKIGTLKRLIDSAPAWDESPALVEISQRLLERLEAVQSRVDCPLVVATFGGTGTGKSSLVNALVGRDIVQGGRSRPTTAVPAVVHGPDVSLEMLGIDPSEVEEVVCDAPALFELVLIDFPDPDTTEVGDDPAVEYGNEGSSGRQSEPSEGETPPPRYSNLDRVRRLLPHCDALLVTSTQQKYRSARVVRELADQATGAARFYVQTHADRDTDIRSDWRELLGEDVSEEDMFLVDCRPAADKGAPSPERTDLDQLLDRLVSRSDRKATERVRRFNVERLLAETSRAIQIRTDRAAQPLNALQDSLDAQRVKLHKGQIDRLRETLPQGTSHWEQTLLVKIASNWGFGPFSVVLRIYQSLGAILTAALLTRMRSTAQLAVWGVWEGARTLHSVGKKRKASHVLQTASDESWDERSVREAAFLLRGYASDAGLDRSLCEASATLDEAERAGRLMVDRMRTSVDRALTDLARRCSGFVTRWTYDIILLGVAGYIFYLPARNFFYDSRYEGAELLGPGHYGVSIFWLLAVASLMLWWYLKRTRKRLKREILQLAIVRHDESTPDDEIMFGSLQRRIDDIRAFVGKITSLGATAESDS